MNWKDVTSYSRHDIARIPETLEWRPTQVPGIRIVVTKHIHYGDEWLMLCEAVNITRHQPLKTTDIDEAKAQAVGIFRSAAQRLMNRLAVAIEETRE